MSLVNENMEQLFAAAKNLPGEFSPEEVELIFLNPAPLPPARPWHGSYLKFFTMLSIMLAAVLSVMLLTPDQNMDLALTNTSNTENLIGPTAVTLSTSPIKTDAPESRPVKTMVANKPISTPPIQPLPLAPIRIFAPAAAPPKVPTPTHQYITSTNPSLRPSVATSDRKIAADLPIPIFSGHWKLRKSRLQLSLLEITSDKQEQHFFLATLLTKAELSKATNSEVAAGKIERATGTVILQGGKKRGTFEFIPNASFRDRLNAIGLGDGQLPEGENPRIPVLPSSIKPGVCSDTDHPRELLWLKYFVYNVNDHYLKVLYDHGYSNNELLGLYHLPDYGVKRLTLINLLSLTDQLFAERVPIKDLARMSWRITYINALIGNGHTDMTLEAFWNKEDNKPLGLSLLASPDSIISPLIGELGIPTAQNNDQPLVGTLGTLTSMLDNDQSILGASRMPTPLFTDSTSRVFGAPVIDFELPVDWGTGTPGYTVSKLDVTAFSKLMIKGNIRLYLNHSDAPREISVFASHTARSALSIKQSGNRVKLTNTSPTESIDIEISGPFLESIRTSGHKLFLKKATVEK